MSRSSGLGMGYDSDSGDDTMQVDNPLLMGQQFQSMFETTRIPLKPSSASHTSTTTSSRMERSNASANQQQHRDPTIQQQRAGASSSLSVHHNPTTALKNVSLVSASGSSVDGTISEMGTGKHVIPMEFGDEYVGEATTISGGGTNILVPHGAGTLQSMTGRHCYVGDFAQRLREGQGKLVTEQYVLWSKWKANRPDLSSSVRIDYTNGEKYCGYLSAVTDPKLQQAIVKSGQSLSKFSQWVQTTVLQRERWGEMVYINGNRYFGQWEGNLESGFGCAVFESGDRYIGNFWKGRFHGPGTLFTSTKNATSLVLGHTKPTGGGGIVYDGHWEMGMFDSEEGHVTFPSRARLTGEWRNSQQVSEGSICYPSRSDTEKRWFSSFQWETLLCGCSETARKRDYNAAASMRASILAANVKVEVDHCVNRLIRENSSVANSLKIFRRCFYFLYGTCGSSGEIGAGLGANKLGWCYVRNCLGGCIHRGRGKRIESEDISHALGDIISFVMSLRRWIDELVGEKGASKIYDFDCDVNIGRHLLDLVLADVHPPLFNLYVQVYRKEQVALSAALQRLSELTLDDLGVSFGRHGEEERLFSPYEDAIRSLQSLSKATSLNAKLACLKKWSSDIDLSTRLGQMKIQEEELTKLSSFFREKRKNLDTIGNNRQGVHSPGKPTTATDPEEAAAQSQMVKSPASGPVTPSVTAQQSTGGDAMTTSTQQRFAVTTPPQASMMPPPPDSQSDLIQPMFFQALAVQSGSADDLLPIHQYVLMRSDIPYLFAHAQLLLDLSMDENFVDSTSQDSFCITTLHACLTIIPQLYRDLRDECNIVTPVSVFEKRMEDVVSTAHSASEAGAMRRKISHDDNSIQGETCFDLLIPKNLLTGSVHLVSPAVLTERLSHATGLLLAEQTSCVAQLKKWLPRVLEYVGMYPFESLSTQFGSGYLLPCNFCYKTIFRNVKLAMEQQEREGSTSSPLALPLTQIPPCHFLFQEQSTLEKVLHHGKGGKPQPQTSAIGGSGPSPVIYALPKRQGRGIVGWNHETIMSAFLHLGPVGSLIPLEDILPFLRNVESLILPSSSSSSKDKRKGGHDDNREENAENKADGQNSSRCFLKSSIPSSSLKKRKEARQRQDLMALLDSMENGAAVLRKVGIELYREATKEEVDRMIHQCEEETENEETGPEEEEENFSEPSLTAKKSIAATRSEDSKDIVEERELPSQNVAKEQEDKEGEKADEQEGEKLQQGHEEVRPPSLCIVSPPKLTLPATTNTNIEKGGQDEGQEFPNDLFLVKVHAFPSTTTTTPQSSEPDPERKLAVEEEGGEKENMKKTKYYVAVPNNSMKSQYNWLADFLTVTEF